MCPEHSPAQPQCLCSSLSPSLPSHIKAPSLICVSTCYLYSKNKSNAGHKYLPSVQGLVLYFDRVHSASEMLWFPSWRSPLLYWALPQYSQTHVAYFRAQKSPSPSPAAVQQIHLWEQKFWLNSPLPDPHWFADCLGCTDQRCFFLHRSHSALSVGWNHLQLWKQCTGLPSVALCTAAEAACESQLQFFHAPLSPLCCPVRRYG